MFEDLLGKTVDVKIKAKTILQENTYYYVKLTRLYHPKPKLEWHGKTRFHIQRRKDGNIGVLAVKDAPIPWAEYCHEDIEPDGKCICEDYLMEIL